MSLLQDAPSIPLSRSRDAQSEHTYGRSVGETRMEGASHTFHSADEERRLIDVESETSRMRRAAELGHRALSTDWARFLNEVRSAPAAPTSIFGCLVRFGEVSPAFVAAYLDEPDAVVNDIVAALNSAGLIEVQSDGRLSVSSFQVR